jgi:hypothetical protein
MSWLTDIFYQWSRGGRAAEVEPKKRQLTDEAARPPRSSRRITTEGYEHFGTRAILAPQDPLQKWRYLELGEENLAYFTVSELIDCIGNVSPEIDNALWNWLRLLNPGWKIEATDLNGEKSEAGQAVIDTFLKRLARQHGSFDVLINKANMGALTRGAYFMELVIGSDGRTAVDLALPDPITARFIKDNDEERGEVWQLAQWQTNKCADLSEAETVRYYALDPSPGNPYGRIVISSSIFLGWFLLSMLKDLRRVIGNQGWPRVDIAISLEAIKNAMPREIKGDEEKFRLWVNETIKEIDETYRQLRPSDAYIHSDTITVNSPVGTMDSSISAIDDVFHILERMIVRGLKQMPIIQGITEGTTESNARYQWAFTQIALQALQKSFTSTINPLLDLVLQAEGIQGQARIEFEAVTIERLRTAQAEQIEIANEAAKYDRGWISQEEASYNVTGHAASQEEPRATSEASPTNILYMESSNE